jgi:prepilin-type N-terminal cleavage/methylation domain-containing protein
MIHDRRGFTLVELIVVSVLGAFVLAAVLQVLITNQRTYTAQSAVIEGQQSARMSLELLFNELREVSASGGDIISMSPTALTVRLMRKLGVVCATDLSATPPTLTVLNHEGARFEDGDRVFVFADNDDQTASDDTWITVPSPIEAVDTTSTCLSRDASLIEFKDTDAPAFVANTVRVGAPMRSFQTFSFDTDDLPGLTSDTYLRVNGMPVAGPLRATNGLQFIYRDAMGAVTATEENVRQIEVRIRTGTGVQNSLNQQVSDSITAWIYTRN